MEKVPKKSSRKHLRRMISFKTMQAKGYLKEQLRTTASVKILIYPLKILLPMYDIYLFIIYLLYLTLVYKIIINLA